jgi:hypothetical protein
MSAREPRPERVTYELQRPMSPLVLVGLTTDGTAVYRPLTPEAERMLAEMTNQGATGRHGQGRALNTKPPAPVREGAGAHRRQWPTWFLVGVLTLLAMLTGALVWAVVTLLTMVATFFGWLAGSLALIIGCCAVGIAVGALLVGRRVVINQYARVG